jgi:hypothetical protein
MQARQIKLAHLVLGALLAYIPLHLLEEGLGGFPAWAEQYWQCAYYARRAGYHWALSGLPWRGTCCIGASR